MANAGFYLNIIFILVFKAQCRLSQSELLCLASRATRAQLEEQLGLEPEAGYMFPSPTLKKGAAVLSPGPAAEGHSG